MHAALIKRRVANLAPVGGRGFWWYSEGLTENPRANAGIAPDGTNTAVKVTANTSASPHYIYGFAPGHAPATPLNAPYAYSIFVKSAGWRHVTVNYQWNSTPHFIRLDLLTGMVTLGADRNTHPRAYRVETLSDGWYRVSITEANPASGDMNPGVGLVDAAGNTDTPGDGTSGILLWGYQINTGGPAPYNPAPPLI